MLSISAKQADSAHAKCKIEAPLIATPFHWQGGAGHLCVSVYCMSLPYCLIDNLLASTQGSRLPVPTKKTSLNTPKRSSGCDMDASGDSGFADASEFSLFKLDGYSK